MSIGIGVIGAGVMGAEHARILRHETPGAHLAGIFDANADRAQAVASRATVFSDPQSLIASDQIDAIVIASPDATHAALTRACIATGKPVLCEKPLASSAADALDVVQAEVALGRRLIQVGYMRRFDPGYQEIKRVKDTGELGGPVLLHNVHRNVRAPEWFNGSMAITNSFVHEIDISRWLLGSEMVSAHVEAGPGGEPLMITMKTDKDEIVSTDRGFRERRLRLPRPCRTGRSAWHGIAGAGIADAVEQRQSWRSFVPGQLGAEVRRGVSQADGRLGQRCKDRSVGPSKCMGRLCRLGHRRASR